MRQQQPKRPCQHMTGENELLVRSALRRVIEDSDPVLAEDYIRAYEEFTGIIYTPTNRIISTI